MPIPYTQSTMASVRAVDGTYISYPFLEDGDTSTKVYNMVCTQRAVDYQANQVELDDPMTSAATAGVLELPFPSDSSAYFIGDTNHTTSPGGMLQFSRTFANIPQPITKPSASAAYSFPGISDGNLLISDLSQTLGTDGIFITTATPHGFSVGSDAFYTGIAYFVDDGTTTTPHGFGDLSEGFVTTTSSPVLEVVSSTKFRINPSDLYTPTVAVTLTLRAGDITNRDKVGLIVNSLAMNTTYPAMRITTSLPHGLSAGVYVNIIMRFTVGTDPFVYVVNGRYEVVSNAGTNVFLVDLGLYFSSIQTVSVASNGRVFDRGNIRESVSYDVVTSTRYNYFLPGVTAGISDPSDITVPQSFSVKDQTGAVVNKTANSRIVYTGSIYYVYYATSPNSTEYLSMVTNKGNIVMESSLNQWAGNILVLKTKTCKAQ